MGIADVVRLMSVAPATLCGLNDRKSRLAVGYDADFCVWDPEAQFTVSSDIIRFQNKANPYMGKKLKGVVHATVLRGRIVYEDQERNVKEPFGQFVLKNVDDKC